MKNAAKIDIICTNALHVCMYVQFTHKNHLEIAKNVFYMGQAREKTIFLSKELQNMLFLKVPKKYSQENSNL